MIPSIIFGVTFLGFFAGFLITAKYNPDHRRQALGGAVTIIWFGLLFIHFTFPEAIFKLVPQLPPHVLSTLVPGLPIIWGTIISLRRISSNVPWRPAVLYNPSLIGAVLITSLFFLNAYGVLRGDLFIYACAIALAGMGVLSLAALLGLIRKESPKYRTLYREILNQPDVSPQNVVKYPPAAGGIEVKPLKEILSGHKELLRNIELSTETGEIFDNRYWPAIERYANLVHLLPASENDHHREAGGLLHHGLEVGYYAMALARAGMYGREYGLQKREGRERWLFACFMAGLCHDLGKVVNDVRVSADGGLTWSPDSERLTDWAAKHGLTRYYADWQPNRHKVHENLTLGMLGRVLTDDDRQYISEMDTQLSKQIMLALTPSNGADAPSIRPYNIRGMLQEADSRSVKEDKTKSRTPADLGLERPTPMVRHYHDGVQRLFQTGKWRINESGAAAWVIGPAKDLYLVWPRCGLELYESLQDEGVKGAPASPEVIADIMAGSDLLVPAPEGGFYWRIKPEDLEGGPLTALRINPKFVPNFLNPLPPGLNALVQADEGMSSSWSYVGMDDKAGSASTSPSGQVIQIHPTSPEMHGTSGPGPENAVMPPRMGPSLPPAGYVQQPAEVEKPIGKGGWSAAQILLIGISIGVLGVLGVLTYYGKHWYGDELSFWWYFWAAWKTCFERTYMHWTAFVTVVVVVIIVFVIPKFRFEEKEAEKKAAKIEAGAQEILDGAKQEAIDIRAAAAREGGEIKKAAKDEAAEIRIKAKEEAAEVREQAAQDAEAIRKRAEEDGAKVMAQTKIKAQEIRDDYWLLLQEKAKDMDISSEELQGLVIVLQQAKEKAAAIMAQAPVQAQEVKEKIIVQAQGEAREIIVQAQGKAREIIDQAQIESQDVLHRARVDALDTLMSGRKQELDVQKQAAQQSQENQQGQDEHVHDQPVQDDMVEAGTSPEGDMDDQGQEAARVAALEKRIMDILFGQQGMKKRDLERKVNKSRYEDIWELAVNELLSKGKIVYDPDEMTYRCQHELFQ